MTDSVIIVVIGFLGSLVAIITPLIRLNNTISRLATTIDLFRDEAEQKHDNFDRRITEHGKEIDELEKTTVNHEVRISGLEKEKKS